MEHTRLFKCPYCTQKVGLIYICNEMKNIIEKYYYTNKNEIIIDSNYNIIEDKNEEKKELEFIKLNESNDNSNNNNYGKDIEEIFSKNTFSGIRFLNNINDVGDIIDEFFLKDDKKKIKNKFVITIKTDWDKFFPPKTWY
jgi:hypothetical protein